MTTVQITLPDQLAQEAQRAGLLSSDTIERILRAQLKTQHVDELFQAIDQMAALASPTALSPEEELPRIDGHFNVLEKNEKATVLKVKSF